MRQTEKKCEIRFNNLPYSDPFEYFCYDCGKLNLSFCITDVCLSCYSTNIIKGKILELNKEKLQEEFRNKNKGNTI